MEVDIYLHIYIYIYMEIDIHGGRYIFAQIYLHIHGGRYTWRLIYICTRTDGRLSSLLAVGQLSHTWKSRGQYQKWASFVLKWQKTSTTFIIHIQKRNNHQSTLLSAKNYIQLWSLLLPMTSYTNIYLDMTIDLQL